ncbi:ABC transporter ATP-binding protein [Corynebacterium mendelii]|uniref:ABC-type quaternary amine transporter n=1 Tax=Corynebacterium mendelii TaxID=2765362 RepID=A0A939ITR0_9CORY|nr:ATP-binding cassette domain-containing protein [Corynebacterium mendelii]MBN9644119.1 ATP-binding cassette domain-containing protein [Corynebacterium mendelii]
MIEFDAVSKVFPGAGEPAVDNFSLTIPAHTTTALVGSSGSGKTTLLRMVNRMVEPTSGQVRIDGRPVADDNPVMLRRRIGYVMQNSGLLPHKTIVDNITVVPRLNGTSPREATTRALELLELLGLDPGLADRYPAELSGGQAQRVGVARALADDPNILLMDEPFGAVDPVVRRDLQQEILSIQSQLEKTIVLVTHDIDEAFMLADRIVLLEKGAQIAQQGSAEDFITRPASDFVSSFVGVDSRRLTVATRGDRQVVLDGRGRVTGVVSEEK